ncbi:blarina toxin-like [Oppia nitens]|uniref:blarina toxin-like n=1 Tax=Oppia nitens TaxID=1686743 RepID=UPI0023DB8691|nr:blarina toxin-like [Oppia nitens]
MFNNLLYTTIDTGFLTVGNYSDYEHLGLNQPECGLVGPLGANQYDPKCFRFHSDNSRIIAGTDSLASPWTVKLVFVDPTGRHNDGLCTGVLITLQFLLTAAHCLDQYEKFELHVYEPFKIGDFWGSRPADSAYWYKHPLYKNWTIDKSRLKYNLALVRLDHPFRRYEFQTGKWSSNPVCLPVANITNGPPSADTGRLFGWGVVDDGREEKEIVRQMSVKLSANSQCNHTELLCLSYDSGARPCRGDDGGPIVQYKPIYWNSSRAILAGLHTDRLPPGTRCSRQNAAYGVPISPWMDWILEQILIVSQFPPDEDRAAGADDDGGGGGGGGGRKKGITGSGTGRHSPTKKT